MDTLQRLTFEVQALKQRLSALETREYVAAAGNADTVDLLHAATSGANAHVLATDASGNTIISAALAVLGQMTLGSNVVRGVFTKDLPDNAATAVFRIHTTDEAGDADAGGYSCTVHAVIFDGAAGTVNTAAKSFTAQFGRVMGGVGVGVCTAVTEDIETASVAIDAATRDIGTVTMTAVEVGNEYNVDVKLTVDVTGTGSVLTKVMLIAEVVWVGFTTPPVLSQQ